MIYVHSKVMIVDDRFAIIGSANINDRSMNGDRDSEIALAVESWPTGYAIPNDEWPVSGGFAKSLRMHLWAEHLGLLQTDGTIKPENTAVLEDPCSKECFVDLWSQTASNNAEILSHVFPYVPSNRITTLQLFSKESKVEFQ